MEQLFSPHFGLMLWTVVTFLLLVVILGKFGWGPLIKSLGDREAFLREQRQGAEEARLAAERMRTEYQEQLERAQTTIRDMLAQARADGEQSKTQIVAAAREESERIVEKGRKDLASDTERIRQELRSEVAGLSVMIAEKVLRRAIDAKVQEQVLADALKSVGEVKK